MINSKPVQLLMKLDQLVEKMEGWTLILILFVLMCVAFLQVVLRNFFSTALPWGDGLTRALVLWAGFVGGSLAIKQGRYLNTDVLTRLFPSNWKRRARCIVYIYTILVCFFLGYAGLHFVASEREAMTMSSLGVANWIVASVIPAVFFLICFRFGLKAMCLMMGGELEKHEWER